MTVRRAGWLAAAGAASLLLGVLGWSLAHPAATAPGPSIVGRPAPDFAIQRLDGGRMRLSELRGRPVVLNFWASWCGPCRQEEAVLREAANARGAGVAFVGVAIQDSPESARKAAERAAYPYPVGLPAGAVPRAYGLTGPPETFFIDQRGVVVARYFGPLETAAIHRYLQLVDLR